MKSTKKEKKRILFLLQKHRSWLILGAIFIVEIFLRFYQIDTRNPFGWDQVNNAWAAQDIIVNHRLPLLGFQAKLNSGIYIGPLYYYLIAIPYFVTQLDPIASGIFAGITSIFTFFVLFYVAKKIFSWNVAFFAVLINTVAVAGIMWDRIQGSINFIPAISLLIFYSLYKVITGHPKYTILFAISLGFIFHIHLSAVFFPFIILVSLPFVPRTKEMLKFSSVALFIFVLFFVPSIIAFIQNAQHVVAAKAYSQGYYHGFHARRVMQLFNDAFIQFEPYLLFPVLYPLKFLMIPFFALFYVFRGLSREKVLFIYLLCLWFVVPWFVLSTYAGEISDYYFSANRFLVVIILAYLLTKFFELKFLVAKAFVLLLLVFYSYININKFLTTNITGIYHHKQVVQQAIDQAIKIEFYEGDPKSFIYYYLMRQKGKTVY